MTEHEVDQIRKKFIWVSTLTLFAVMLLMGGCIYLFSETTIRNEAYQIMETIAENTADGVVAPLFFIAFFLCPHTSNSIRQC